MICLTCDLHHMSLNTGNQQHCDITEIEVASQFLELLAKADVKATFFVSGRAFAEEWDDLKAICASELVEIGGHNYSCLTPSLWHRLCKKAIGSYNGPAWYQRRDIRRTRDIIERRAGRRITAWRNHMYMHGPRTEECLRDCGIFICSDGVKRDAKGPERHPTGVMNFPLNIMPDHEHLYHAERTPEWVDWWVKRYNWSDDYGPQSYYIEEWTERVLDELRQHEQDGVVSNMIVHPITMYLCDRFACFEKILRFLSSCETSRITDFVTGPENGTS